MSKRRWSPTWKVIGTFVVILLLLLGLGRKMLHDYYRSTSFQTILSYSAPEILSDLQYFAVEPHGMGAILRPKVVPHAKESRTKNRDMLVKSCKFSPRFWPLILKRKLIIDLNLSLGSTGTSSLKGSLELPLPEIGFDVLEIVVTFFLKPLDKAKLNLKRVPLELVDRLIPPPSSSYGSRSLPLQGHVSGSFLVKSITHDLIFPTQNGREYYAASNIVSAAYPTCGLKPMDECRRFQL